MSKYLILLIAMCAPLSVFGQRVEVPLSLDDALMIARSKNLTLKLAHEEVVRAEAESRELNALWYPSLMVTGEYSHTTTEIAATTTLGEMGSELLGNLAPIIEANPVIGELGKSELRLPIVPRNSAEVGAELIWVVFSGGRRVAASRISKALLSVANDRYSITQDVVVATVTEAYWGLALARELTRVRRSTLEQHGEHLRQARRLEEEGMINRAERLIAEVAYDQSAALLASAEGKERVAEKLLSSLLAADSLAIVPTTPLSTPRTIPSWEELISLIPTTPTISALKRGSEIASLALNAERSRYLPTISLICHQQLWSWGLDKNIFPRTIVGVGLEWTLFDGLARESAIARSKSTLRSAQTTLQKTNTDLHTAVARYYAMLTTSLEEYRAQQTTLVLAEELVRAQQRAFAEGMATSSEVVDATQRLAEVRLAQLATLYAIDTSLATLLMLVGKADELTTFFTPQ
ncbi:MAG: TolC family protein [Alistipes sp.]|nr:TolC family protein [Alistipes sp.]